MNASEHTQFQIMNEKDSIEESILNKLNANNDEKREFAIASHITNVDD